LLAAEILKMRKRWFPYILLFLLFVFAFVQVFLFGYVIYSNSSDSFEQQDAIRAFSIPWSLQGLLDSGQFWGSLITGIFASSTVATEFGWGTVRQALIRGQSRASYLALKIAAITVVAAAGLLLAFFFGLLVSLFSMSLTDRTITLDVPGGPSVPEIVLMVLRAGYCIIPYGMLAFCLSTVARSTTAGVITVVLFLFGEAIILGILNGLGGSWADMRDLSIGHNVRALLAENQIGGGNPLTLAPREGAIAGEVPDPNGAALILAFWILTFAAVSFAVFQRRDLRS
jgi:ABC-2 type transport system permease protein